MTEMCKEEIFAIVEQARIDASKKGSLQQVLLIQLGILAMAILLQFKEYIFS